MRSIRNLTFALFAATAFVGGPAYANMCQAGKLSCATAMPVDGYCECTSHGTTESGTSVAKLSRMPSNSTAGGCGAHPNAPGCR